MKCTRRRGLGLTGGAANARQRAFSRLPYRAQTPCWGGIFWSGSGRNRSSDAIGLEKPYRNTVSGTNSTKGIQKNQGFLKIQGIENKAVKHDFCRSVCCTLNSVFYRSKERIFSFWFALSRPPRCFKFLQFHQITEQKIDSVLCQLTRRNFSSIFACSAPVEIK